MDKLRLVLYNPVVHGVGVNVSNLDIVKKLTDKILSFSVVLG